MDDRGRDIESAALYFRVAIFMQSKPGGVEKAGEN